MSAHLNEPLKTALLLAWAEGQRELVIITFKVATLSNHRDVATWIHTEFADQYTAAEMADLTDFAICLIIEKLANAAADAADAAEETSATAAANAAIARAKAH